MQVIKRDGRGERVCFDKISGRIQKLCYGLHSLVDPILVSQKVVSGVYDGVSTEHLDELASETAAFMSTRHPDFALLAGRIAISNLHKTTVKNFSALVSDLVSYKDKKSGRSRPLVTKEFADIVNANKERLDAAIIYERDMNYDFFGYRTMHRSYLLKIDGKVAERPQHMLMRVAVGIWKDDIEKAIEMYNQMSLGLYTHATPTLFNAGTPGGQLASCFLLSVTEDSIDGIYKTLTRCANISKHAGGIGLSISNVRASQSYIQGSGGTSNGLIPMLRVFDASARYVDQGGGKRKGGFAMYLEVWHADISDFLELKKNHGKEELRARDLFYGLWICDLFMKRVEKDEKWTLFCPNDCPDLVDLYGDAFEKRYIEYEEMKNGRRTIRAQDLWMEIISSQIETGTPYMLYKDAANEKSNQKNLGTLRGSNLCTEILEYTSPDEVAVCNLASIALPMFVKNGTFDFEKLKGITKRVTENLNKVIDVTVYPVEEAKRSNMKHRPIGIGVQGLADTFLKLGLSFDSEQARKLNRDIFETMYYAALDMSQSLAAKHGTYESYPGSPASKDILQHDMWKDIKESETLDWKKLREDIKKNGLRNSLLMAPMPTASTAQILGNTECFEPITSNIYSRRVLSGEFPIVNKFLVNVLLEHDKWNTDTVQSIMANNGSIQHLDLPENVKEMFRTVWEIKQRAIIEMAADRGAFIDQSQSLNLFVDKPTNTKLSSMHFYAWKKGLKGSYYLRSRAAAEAVKFTVSASATNLPTGQTNTPPDVSETCSRECTSCGA